MISRQLGKTALIQALFLKECAKRPGDYFFCAPTYERSEQVYEKMVNAFHDLVQAKLVRPKKTAAGWKMTFSRDFTFMGRPSELFFKSLHDYEYLRGPTLRGFAIDEAGMVPGKAHRTVLLPMIRNLDGWSVLLGTVPDPAAVPDPGFFKEAFKRAVGPDKKHWGINRDYHGIPDERVIADIEADRSWTPIDEFRREYLVLFEDEELFRLPPYLDFEEDPTGILWTGSGIDLADNEQEIGDKAAVVTWFVTAKGHVWVKAGEYYQNPSEVLDALYFHFGAYGVNSIKLQKTGFDKGFRYTVEEAQRDRGFLPIEMHSLGGASKRRRIMQLEPLARAGKLHVHKSLVEFALEWQEFPDGLTAVKKRNRRGNHYDMLDALSPCIIEARHYSTVEPEPEMQRNTFAAAMRAAKLKARGARHQDAYIPG